MLVFSEEIKEEREGSGANEEVDEGKALVSICSMRCESDTRT
jgi:hypothetical protein